jgi:hypothetical protein
LLKFGRAKGQKGRKVEEQRGRARVNVTFALAVGNEDVLRSPPRTKKINFGMHVARHQRRDRTAGRHARKKGCKEERTEKEAAKGGALKNRASGRHTKSDESQRKFE